MPPKQAPNRSQVIEILSRYRAAKTERERIKVVNSIKSCFPAIAEKLTKIQL